MVTQIVPQFFTPNLEKTFAWYRDNIGFTTEFIYGEPAFYGGVERDGQRIYFRRVDEMPATLADKYKEDMLDCMVRVDDVDTLYKEFQGKSVPFQQEIANMGWGARTFIVKDCDNRLLCFAGQPEE